MKQESYKITPRCCPNCHKEVNMAATAFGDDGAPSPGDFDICAYCAHLTEVNIKGEYVSVDEARLKEISRSEPAIYKMLQMAIAEVKKMRL